MINDFQALYTKEIDEFYIIINGYNYKVVHKDKKGETQYGIMRIEECKAEET